MECPSKLKRPQKCPSRGHLMVPAGKRESVFLAVAQVQSSRYNTDYGDAAALRLRLLIQQLRRGAT